MSEERDLRDAFAALRDEHAGATEASSATRTRILLAASKRRRRKLVVLRVVVPLAAVLALSTAWAAVTGRLPHVFDRVPERAVAPPPPPAASSVVVVPMPTPPAPTKPESVAHVAAPEATTAAARASVSAKAPLADAEDALYRRAHHAHFVEKDAARALAAWDAYLAAHPNGRFAPEARYNRALSLVRLGRTDEAREALRPFAEGRFADYRRREAQKLLDALDDAAE